MRLRELLLAGAAAALAVAGPAQAQTSKTAEEAFKNIQALRGTPADQLMPAMQVMAASLGVECEFCHVQGKFDADDKGNKKTARKMIAMMQAINKDNFNARVEVTCYTCHHGNNDPVGIAPVESAEAAHGHEEATTGAQAPTVDQVLEKYVAAVGGAEAIHKISSRVEKGNIIASGQESPVEVFAKAPNKRLTMTHMGKGESITAFDGTTGWLGNSTKVSHVMSDVESAAYQLDADFYFATHMKEVFSRLRVGRPDKVDDRPAVVVIGQREGQPPVRLYFDESSGLLVRLVRYAVTPVGRNPTQIDYADYREVDGVKIPFRWTLARINGRFTIQIKEAQQNVAIPDEKFTRPAGSAETGAAQH